MTARIISQALTEYQTARLTFTKAISDLASRSENVGALEGFGVVNLLEPLVFDRVSSIQQNSLIALGKLANSSSRVAQDIMERNIIPILTKNIEKQNKFIKKAILFVIRAISKHSSEMAKAVVDSGGLGAIIVCLEDFDTGVKESAAWATGYIARHDKSLAETVTRAGAVPLLVLCLHESELCLKQISASALCDISKHSQELAQAVADAGAIPFFATLMYNPDAKLKNQVLYALASIAKHSADLAEAVVETDIFPQVLILLGHPDENVEKAGAILIREIVKHSQELAQLIVNTGGIEALIELIRNTKSSTRLPGIMSLGYIAGHSCQSAITIIASKGVSQLSLVLNEESDHHILAMTIWACGQIGKHSREHAKAVAEGNIFPKMLQLYKCKEGTEDLKEKIVFALKNILDKCVDIEFLEPLLYAASPEILKYTLKQLSKILPNDPQARRLLVTTGGLRQIQEIQLDPGSSLFQYITIINSCFPEEIIRYFSPGYHETILEIVDMYQPKLTTFFEDSHQGRSSSDKSSSSLSLNNQDAKIK